MKAKPKVVRDGRTVTVRVPISIRKRGGRKLVLAPDGGQFTLARNIRHIDNVVMCQGISQNAKGKTRIVLFCIDRCMSFA